jgi:hypothetical protein
LVPAGAELVLLAASAAAGVFWAKAAKLDATKPTNVKMHSFRFIS